MVKITIAVSPLGAPAEVIEFDLTGPQNTTRSILPAGRSMDIIVHPGREVLIKEPD